MLPEDAEQIGFFGVMEAARRFRPDYGFQFSTYATPWIKQACQRFGPSFSLLIRLPDHAFWASFRLRLTVDRMFGALGATGVHDFLTELDLRDPKAASYLRDLERVTGIDSLSDRKQPAYRAARQIAEPWKATIDEMKQSELVVRIQKAVSSLWTREAQIIRLRYGFDGCPAQTLEEIGELFSITKERVRQLQVRAEKRLRGLLCEEFDDQFPQSQRGEQAEHDRQSEISTLGIGDQADGEAHEWDGQFAIPVQTALLQNLVAQLPNEL